MLRIPSKRQPELVQPWHRERKHQWFICALEALAGKRGQEVMSTAWHSSGEAEDRG